ncbi:MAG: hypothetical protein WBN89_00615 [Prochlorococcaceae cyanobacterium]
MNTTTAPHPVEILLLAVLVTAAALIDLAAGLAALHRRPRPALPPAAAVPALPPAPPPPPVPDLAGLTVRELRRVARAAGYRTLARSGRRVDLLAVLGAA